jgi:hypothetical protein
MTWGEKMHRKSFMSKVKIGQEAASGNRAERRSGAAQAFSAELDMMNEQVSAYEFSVSIIDHNLEYKVGTNDDGTDQLAKLDFKNPAHLKMLDGTIGEEIDDLITNLNDFENDPDTGKS